MPNPDQENQVAKDLLALIQDAQNQEIVTGGSGSTQQDGTVNVGSVNAIPATPMTPGEPTIAIKDASGQFYAFQNNSGTEVEQESTILNRRSNNSLKPKYRKLKILFCRPITDSSDSEYLDVEFFVGGDRKVPISVGTFRINRTDIVNYSNFSEATNSWPVLVNTGDGRNDWFIYQIQNFIGPIHELDAKRKIVYVFPDTTKTEYEELVSEYGVSDPDLVWPDYGFVRPSSSGTFHLGSGLFQTEILKVLVRHQSSHNAYWTDRTVDTEYNRNFYFKGSKKEKPTTGKFSIEGAFYSDTSSAESTAERWGAVTFEEMHITTLFENLVNSNSRDTLRSRTVTPIHRILYHSLNPNESIYVKYSYHFAFKYNFDGYQLVSDYDAAYFTVALKWKFGTEEHTLWEETYQGYSFWGSIGIPYMDRDFESFNNINSEESTGLLSSAANNIFTQICSRVYAPEEDRFTTFANGNIISLTRNSSGWVLPLLSKVSTKDLDKIAARRVELPSLQTTKEYFSAYSLRCPGAILVSALAPPKKARL